MRGKQLTCAQLSGRRATAALARIANLPARHFPTAGELQVHPSPSRRRMIVARLSRSLIIQYHHHTTPRRGSWSRNSRSGFQHAKDGLTIVGSRRNWVSFAVITVIIILDEINAKDCGFSKLKTIFR